MKKDKKPSRWWGVALTVCIVGGSLAFAVYRLRPPSIQTEKVSAVQVEAEGLYEEALDVTVEEKEEIEELAKIEKEAHKYRGKCSLIKTTPWRIRFTYRMENGKTVSREYVGQRGKGELQYMLVFLTEDE